MNKPIPFGKYYLLDRINVGGMAEVFRAKAFGVEGFERVVAVKRILPSIAEDTEFITMFIDEAKIAVQLTHANIAQIFDLGKVGDSYFIALEYVHGKDLRALFDRARKRAEALPVPLACYVVMKVCEGLDYAHNKRDSAGRPLELVHRDVSPQNILVSHDGEVKIIDFGIAKAANKAGKTQAGILKGKFGYLSPEQVRGEPIDRRSDVFAVGICLYEMLTGERLFTGDSDFSSVEMVRTAQVVEPHTVNANVPQELGQIVMRALDRDVNARFQTALDLHDALQAFLHSSGNQFGRKDLSAWMRTTFAAEVEGTEAGQASDAGSPEATEVDAFESTESADVELQSVTKDQDREVAAANVSQSSAGKGPPKSTLLGMPAMDGARPTSRTAPPPPPSSRRATESGPAPRGTAEASGDLAHGRSAPPPPPSSSGSAPGEPRVRSVPPPPPGSSPPAGGYVPSRTLPPPPHSSIPPSASADPASAPNSPAQQSAHGPVLDMDWDDEELSTQIYDRPEDSQEEPLPGHGSARHIPTYVPPVSHSGVVPSASPGVEPAPSYDPSPTPATRQPAPTQEERNPFAPARGSNTAMVAAVAALAVAVVGFALYLFTSGAEPGVLQLATNPADAQVSLDGEPIQGTSSPYLISNIDPGAPHQLSVEKEGFKAWSQQVQVGEGQRLEFTVSLEPADGSAGTEGEGVGGMPTPPPGVEFDPKKTGFSVESSPPGAKVYLNGEDLGGVTPMRVTGLVPGKYRLRVELDGYKAAPASTIEVGADEVRALPKYVLVGEPVSVTFESDPPGARVRLVRGDERVNLGTTPLTSVVEPAGEAWTVEMSADGYETYTGTLTLPAGESEARFAAELEKESSRSRARAARRPRSEERSSAPAPSPSSRSSSESSASASSDGVGVLRVNSRPWSNVSVDGKPVGHTPLMNLRLPSGSHTLQLVNPEENLRKTLTVNVSAGETTTKIVTLE